jgi:hypothetical protein
MFNAFYKPSFVKIKNIFNFLNFNKIKEIKEDNYLQPLY